MRGHAASFYNPLPLLAPRSSPKILPRINAFSKQVGYHLETLFLFTKSDMKTTVIPCTIFAVGTAPVCGEQPILNAVKAFFWVWSVILQFNLTNQTVLPEEDAQNKPWRPIPSGRISLQNAIILRWISIPFCALVSLYFRGMSTVLCSIAFTFLASVYNFYGADKNGFMKSFMNGLGYCVLALGTTLVAMCDAPESWSWRQFPELTIFFFLITTSIHAQDFQDVDGDREVGRYTIPMMSQDLSRLSMPIILPVWSAILVSLCHPPEWFATIFFGLSLVVGLRYYLLRRVEDDKFSYFLYNMWLSLTIVNLGMYKGARKAPHAVSWVTDSPMPFRNNLTFA